ncbi:nebulette-like [Bufo gargarizans]|uniref:nebulette-like n=1 Tax=Bufo gargarizans TaxID=30331 RepID=UPI001CF4FC01|nr:nebulette-like [Bufo gargarizans]
MKIPIIIDSAVDDSDEEEKVFPNPVLEDRSVEFAKKCTEYISDISYREKYKKLKGKNEFVPDTAKLKAVTDSISETKYKEAGRKELSHSLYQMMPATLDTAFAKQVTELQSEVLYKQKHDADKGKSTYAQMLEPPDIKHAMEVNRHQSNVSYKKKNAQEIHKYTEVMNRPDIRKATEISKIISNVDYKKAKGDLSKESMVLGRPDFEHAKEMSKITSQVKYKEHFKEMKGKNHCYNPLDSAVFRSAQAATDLASDVRMLIYV